MTSREIREYTQTLWTLADLEAIVSDLSGWSVNSEVRLTAPSPQSRAGTLEVVKVT